MDSCAVESDPCRIECCFVEASALTLVGVFSQDPENFRYVAVDFSDGPFINVESVN